MAYGFDTSFNMTGPSIGQAYGAAKDKDWSDIFSAESSSPPKNDDKDSTKNPSWGDALLKASSWLNDRNKYQNQATTPSFFNINPNTKDKSSQSPFKLADDISILPGTQAGQFTIPGAPGKPGWGGTLGTIAGATIGAFTGGPAGFLKGAQIGSTVGGIGDDIFMG